MLGVSADEVAMHSVAALYRSVLKYTKTLGKLYVVN